MSCYMDLFIGSHNVIEIPELTNSITGLADTGATVSVTLLDSDGAEVDGETWPKSMLHVSAGLYRATLSSALEVVAGESYTASLSLEGSGGEVGIWQYSLIAKVKGQ